MKAGKGSGRHLRWWTLVVVDALRVCVRHRWLVWALSSLVEKMKHIVGSGW